MNDRPQRDDSADRGPRKRDGGRNRDGDRQRRTGSTRSGSTRGDRAAGSGDRPRRDDRDQGRDFGDRGDRRPRRDGDFRDDRRNGRDGDRRPRHDGDFRDERRPYRGGAGGQDRRPRRDGEERRGGERNGERRSYPPRDGEYRGGDRRPRRDGEARGDRGSRRDGGFRDDRRPRRDDGFRGDRRRDGQRDERRNDRPQRDRQESYGRGGTRGGGRSDRGGRGREFTEAERLQHELRPVRAEHRDPVIPDDVRANDLHPAARNELKTLQADIQDRVARHLAMVALLIDDDPELAHQHALSASRRAGRIPVTRETLAITAYRTGDFALALRELRTYRRLSGLDGHVALMVDCERGLGRPEKAIETGLEADVAKLDTEQRVHLAIAMSGARLDLGQAQQALFELEIPELNPQRAFSWSPELFGAYAAVLEDLGRDDEAREWYRHADRAAGALQDHIGSLDQLEVFEIHESEVELDEAAAGEAAHDDATHDEAAGSAASDGEAAVDERAAAGGEDHESSATAAEDEIAAEVSELLAEAGVGEAGVSESAEGRS